MRLLGNEMWPEKTVHRDSNAMKKAAHPRDSQEELFWKGPSVQLIRHRFGPRLLS